MICIKKKIRVNFGGVMLFCCYSFLNDFIASPIRTEQQLIKRNYLIVNNLLCYLNINKNVLIIIVA